MAEITRFVQEFPSLSGPYQTEPVPKRQPSTYPDWTRGGEVYLFPKGVWGKTIRPIAMVSRSRLHDPPTDGLCGHWREGTLHQATVGDRGTQYTPCRSTVHRR